MSGQTARTKVEGQSQGVPDNWYELLSDPFNPEEVGFKPKGKPYNNRMLSFCYIDARSVMERLDLVVGSANWQTSFEDVVGGGVRCTLRIKIDDKEGYTWISKQDVGFSNSGAELDAKIKGAHSDALKRVSVQFGIGRYLYWMDQQWIEYNETKRKFEQRSLDAIRKAFPDWARPKLLKGGRILPKVTEEDSDDDIVTDTDRNVLPAASYGTGPVDKPLAKVAAESDSPEDKRLKAQEEMCAKLASHLSKCNTIQQLGSAWIMVDNHISAGEFTTRQVAYLENHKNSCKGKIAAAASNQAVACKD